MVVSDLITRLEEVLKYSGDINVEGIVNGEIIYLVDVNCPSADDDCYLEFSNFYK